MTAPRPTGSRSVEVILTAEEPYSLWRPEPEVPFRMLIVGDFSGTERQADRSAQRAPAKWRPLRVDRDNLHELPGTLRVSLHSLPLGDQAPAITLKFADLNDFHPDRLVRQIDPLRKLSELRRRLNDPATFPQAAEEVRAWTQPQRSAEARPALNDSSAQERDMSISSTTGLLDQILDQASPSTADLQPTEWQSYLQSLIQPFRVPKAHPMAQELIAQVDVAMSQILRTVLHHARFQALESAWLGLSFLVDRLETDAQLQLYVLDLSKSELAADLLHGDDLHTTQLYQMLVEETIHTPGGHPWAVIGGIYTFDRSRQDVAILERLGRIAKEAGAPFLAAASPSTIGCASFGTMPDSADWQDPAAQQADHQQWQQLRQLSEASFLGLSFPRVLLRLPFGRETEAISTCSFEEMEAVLRHEAYCWGNPTFACLLLLGQAFSADGWQLRPGSVRDVEGLPLHVYQDETGDSVTKPCAEAWLTEKAAEIILDQGLIPLISYKNQDRIRLIRFQSVASPLKPLQGRWS